MTVLDQGDAGKVARGFSTHSIPSFQRHLHHPHRHPPFLSLFPIRKRHDSRSTAFYMPQGLFVRPDDEMLTQIIDRVLIHQSDFTIEQELEILRGLWTAQSEPRTLLDIGCGNGYHIRRIAAAFPHLTVTATDRNAAFLEIARKSATSDENIKFLDADITADTPFAEQSFDIITARLVLQYVTREQRPLLFRRLYSLLKPAGSIFLIDSEDALAISHPPSARISAFWSCLTHMANSFKMDRHIGPSFFGLAHSAAFVDPQFKIIYMSSKSTDPDAFVDYLLGLDATIRKAGFSSFINSQADLTSVRADIHDENSTHAIPLFAFLARRPVSS